MTRAGPAFMQAEPQIKAEVSFGRLPPRHCCRACATPYWHRRGKVIEPGSKCSKLHSVAPDHEDLFAQGFYFIQAKSYCTCGSLLKGDSVPLTWCCCCSHGTFLHACCLFLDRKTAGMDPETGLLYSHDPLACRGPTCWGFGSMWRDTFVVPLRNHLQTTHFRPPQPDGRAAAHLAYTYRASDYGK